MTLSIIPRQPPAGAPASEVLLYELFTQLPELENWTIIHSSHHAGDRANREIDFIALVPDYGILCIEVKGGGFYVRQGQWHRWHDHTPVESPARQSEQAMYALQHELRQQFGTQSPVALSPMECLVVFPDARWPDAVRRPRAGVIDQDDIAHGQFYTKLMQPVLRMRPRTGNRSNLPPTTPDIIRSLQQYLTPDFDMPPRRLPARPRPRCCYPELPSCLAAAGSTAVARRT